MSSVARNSQRGSLVLVVLCFVAVLGIGLASYLALCSRAVQLSNRSVQNGLSKQIAESALEEALRALSKNDWSGWSSGGVSVTWSDNGTNGKKAAITFPISKFGQGVTASAKIRIDNANYATANATWSSAANYRTNDLVGSGGMWYRCVINNSNKSPASNNTYWIQEQSPINWTWISAQTYAVEDIVYYGNQWYRCIAGHTSSSSLLPTNSSYWTNIPNLTGSYNSATYYNTNDIIYYSPLNTWLYCTSPGVGGGAWNYAPISWRWRASKAYNVGNILYYAGVWYTCSTSHTSSSSFDSSKWTDNQSSASMTSTNNLGAWSSTANYNRADIVYYSGSWYRCILAHTASGTITPTNTTYWATAPAYSNVWSSNRQYSRFDTTYYSGVWYLSVNDLNIGNMPSPSSSTWWVGANTTGSTYYIWNATTSYTAGRYVCYGGTWYQSVAANTNQPPNNTTYWTPSWANSFGITTGAPVIYAEGTVGLAGSPSLRTQVRAVVAPAAQFPNAIAANASTVTANSGGTVDSYDSTQGAYGGTNVGYSAVIASAYSAGTAITLSSTTVKGYLAAPSSSTTPFAPLYSSGGTVKGATSPASANIDLSHISRTPYIPKFDTIPGGAGGLAANWSTTPKGTALTLSSTTNIGIPGATTPLRYYYNNTLTIGGSSIQYLNVNGPVILYINGDLFITNSSSTGRINLSSTGSAEIHVTGAFKADVGGAGILSYNTDPKSLIIISDTTGTTTQFYSEGVNPFYGVVYMPYSTGTTGYYNDNTSTQVYGAISANKVTYSGANLNVHYDTSLRYATFGGVDQPFAITQWRELTDPTELATMP